MSFKESIVSVLGKYAEFNGRARRSEYWYFYLLNLIISVAVTMLATFIPITAFQTLISVVSAIWSLGTLIPGIAVAVRRMHDIGKSGWTLLLVLIPIVGFILVIINLTTDSDPNTNIYGPNPKAPYQEQYQYEDNNYYPPNHF